MSATTNLMPPRRVAVFALLAATALSRPMWAQVRADPGTVINGRVAVRVYVTLSDEETSYAPMGGVSLRFFRTTADTVVAVRTDQAGAATTMLVPGEYRLVSTSPVDWKGSRYSWSQLIQVRAGIPTVELTTATAERTALASDSQAASSPTGTTSASRPILDDDGEPIVKDPSAAKMYAFFLPGSGQMYAGERAKGAGLLALSAVGIGIATKQLSCAAASDCNSTTGGMALGAVGMVAFFGSWLYGIMDAPDAARRFNMAHGVVAAGLEPIVEPGAGGRTRVGLSIMVGR